MSSLRLLGVATACILAACSPGRGERARPADDGVAVSASTDPAPEAPADVPSVPPTGGSRLTFTEGEGGDVSMTSTSGALVMALRHDSIVVAFSDSIRRSVQQKVNESMQRDSADAEQGALAQVLKGVVEKSVVAGLGEIFDKARGFPVSSVRDVRYEGGTIRFEYARKPDWTFDDMKVDKTPILASFHPADAARFVGAVRARLR